MGRRNIRCSVYLSREEYDELRRAANELGISVSTLIRIIIIRAIKQGVGEEKQPQTS